jgi:CheY-like chemotaxis protein
MIKQTGDQTSMPSKILLVDDQAFIRHIYSADLRNAGYEVVCAEDGKQALDLLSSSPVDLVLMDAIMPGMDGYSICLKMKSTPSLKNIPVIFLTANADKSAVIKAVQAGANDFFVKCPETDGLLVKINKVLSRVCA